MTWKRRFIFGVLSLAIGSLFALAIGEVLIRIFAPSSPVPNWFQNSDSYVYTLKRNFYQTYPFPGHDYVMEVRTNSAGLRDIEYDSNGDYPGGTILLLGDSFVFGFGVNVAQRFDYQLRELLDGRRLRVINAGVPGWGTLQELAWAREQLSKYDPRVIVLSFCGNDPHDDALFQSGQMVFDEKGLLPLPGKSLLRAHSHLYRFVLTQSRVIRHNLYLRKQRKNHGRSAPLNVQSAEIITAEDWENTRENIRAFHNAFIASRPDGIMLVLATAPWDEHIRENLTELDNGKSLLYVDLFEETASLSEQERRLPWEIGDSHQFLPVGKGLSGKLVVVCHMSKL